MQPRMENLMTCQTTPPQRRTIGVWPARLVGLAIALLATLPITLARQRYTDNQAYLARAIRVQAVVTDLEVAGAPDDRQYTPIYSFQDTHGTQWTVRSPVSYSQPPATIGQAVTLMYDAQNPQNIKRPSIATFWAYIAALLIFSALLLGLGGIVALRGHRFIRRR